MVSKKKQLDLKKTNSSSEALGQGAGASKKKIRSKSTNDLNQSTKEENNMSKEKAEKAEAAVEAAVEVLNVDPEILGNSGVAVEGVTGEKAISTTVETQHKADLGLLNSTGFIYAAINNAYELNQNEDLEENKLENIEALAKRVEKTYNRLKEKYSQDQDNLESVLSSLPSEQGGELSNQLSDVLKTLTEKETPDRLRGEKNQRNNKVYNDFMKNYNQEEKGKLAEAFASDDMLTALGKFCDHTEELLNISDKSLENARNLAKNLEDQNLENKRKIQNLENKREIQSLENAAEVAKSKSKVWGALKTIAKLTAVAIGVAGAGAALYAVSILPVITPVAAAMAATVVVGGAGLALVSLVGADNIKQAMSSVASTTADAAKFIGRGLKSGASAVGTVLSAAGSFSAYAAKETGKVALGSAAFTVHGLTEFADALLDFSVGVAQAVAWDLPIDVIKSAYKTTKYMVKQTPTFTKDKEWSEDNFRKAIGEDTELYAQLEKEGKNQLEVLTGYKTDEEFMAILAPEPASGDEKTTPNKDAYVKIMMKAGEGKFGEEDLRGQFDEYLSNDTSADDKKKIKEEFKEKVESYAEKKAFEKMLYTTDVKIGLAATTAITGAGLFGTGAALAVLKAPITMATSLGKSIKKAPGKMKRNVFGVSEKDGGNRESRFSRMKKAYNTWSGRVKDSKKPQPGRIH